MPPSPSSSVEAARKALAARLREIRRASGLSGAELGARAGWHASKSSRLENGVTPPDDDDIRAWCRICGAQDQTADLIAASRSTDSMYVEWKRLQRTGLRRLQESYIPLFERTRMFRVYCSNVVPGLFQTQAYAGALLSEVARFHETPDDVAEAVTARIDRAHILRQGNHRFAILIEEAVLRHRIGNGETMAGQLGHLLAVTSLPAVSLGVIPFTAARRLWPIETFTIYDTEQAQVELLTAAVTITAPSELAFYVKAFGELGELAVFGGAARTLIASAIEALE